MNTIDTAPVVRLVICPSCKGSMQYVGNVPCGENLPSMQTFQCRCGVTVAIEQALEEQPYVIEPGTAALRTH